MESFHLLHNIYRLLFWIVTFDVWKFDKKRNLAAGDELMCKKVRHRGRDVIWMIIYQSLQCSGARIAIILLSAYYSITLTWWYIDTALIQARVHWAIWWIDEANHAVYRYFLSFVLNLTHLIWMGLNQEPMLIL